MLCGLFVSNQMNKILMGIVTRNKNEWDITIVLFDKVYIHFRLLFHDNYYLFILNYLLIMFMHICSRKVPALCKSSIRRLKLQQLMSYIDDY